MNCFLIPPNGSTYRNGCPLSARTGKQKALRSVEARDERPIVAHLYRGFAEYLSPYPEQLSAPNASIGLPENDVDVDMGSYIRAT